MTRLFNSSKFWLVAIDLIVSLVTYFVTKYAAPEMSKDILFVIGGLQPVMIYLVKAIKDEDVAKIQAGMMPAKPQGMTTEEIQSRIHGAE